MSTYQFLKYKVESGVATITLNRPDVYNALNGSAILAVNSTYGNSWRSPSGILDARLFKFGVQYDF